MSHSGELPHGRGVATVTGQLAGSVAVLMARASAPGSRVLFEFPAKGWIASECLGVENVVRDEVASMEEVSRRLPHRPLDL